MRLIKLEIHLVSDIINIFINFLRIVKKKHALILLLKNDANSKTKDSNKYRDPTVFGSMSMITILQGFRKVSKMGGGTVCRIEVKVAV